MKKTLFTLIFCSIAASIIAQEPWPNKTRILPSELRGIPVSIQIWHTNNPNYAEPAEGLVKTKSKYVWRHSTCITSVYQDLEVIKAGSYIWYNKEGWKLNVQYNKLDFTRKFNCPKGVLVKGQGFTFEDNFRFDNQLYGGDALWYVIAKDQDGKLYKGIGLIETEGKLKSE